MDIRLIGVLRNYHWCTVRNGHRKFRTATYSASNSFMEFRAPFPPTPVVHRRAAVKAYLDGEALCDRGDTKAGIEKMRQAQLLAWELDASDWPAWADHLYSELVNGTPPPPPPPLLGPSSDDEVSSVFLPACLRPCCPIQQWWDRPEALDAISSTLDDQHFVVIDGFAGSAVAQTFRDACEAQWRTGRRFHPAKVAQPGGGTDGARSVLTRSDHITWVDVNGRVDDCEGEGENEEEEAENGEGDEENDRTREFYSGLRSIVRRVDALIRLLRPRLKVEEGIYTSTCSGGDDVTMARQRRWSPASDPRSHVMARATHLRATAITIARSEGTARTATSAGSPACIMRVIANGGERWTVAACVCIDRKATRGATTMRRSSRTRGRPPGLRPLVRIAWPRTRMRRTPSWTSRRLRIDSCSSGAIFVYRTQCCL